MFHFRISSETTGLRFSIVGIGN